MVAYFTVLQLSIQFLLCLNYIQVSIMSTAALLKLLQQFYYGILSCSDPFYYTYDWLPFWQGNLFLVTPFTQCECFVFLIGCCCSVAHLEVVGCLLISKPNMYRWIAVTELRELTQLMIPRTHFYLTSQVPQLITCLYLQIPLRPTEVSYTLIGMIILISLCLKLMWLPTRTLAYPD